MNLQGNTPTQTGRDLSPTCSIIRGVLQGIVVGGCMGILSCCGSTAVGGAMLVCFDWNTFAHPLGAMLITALYMGCLGLPSGILVAVPSGMIMGGCLRCWPPHGFSRWATALSWLLILWGLVEAINYWSPILNPVAPIFPGGWLQHLATLAGVSWGMVYWTPRSYQPRYRNRDPWK